MSIGRSATPSSRKGPGIHTRRGPRTVLGLTCRLHESHDEGCFSVTNNTITRHAASYTTNARFVAFLGTFARPAQQIWLPGNDIQDPTTWDAPSARSRACTGTSCSSTTAPSRLHPNPRLRPLAAAQPPTRSYTRSLPQAPRTTAKWFAHTPAVWCCAA